MVNHRYPGAARNASWRAALFLVALFTFLPVAYAQSEMRDVTTVLETNYGIRYEPSVLQRSGWECPDKRNLKPSGAITRNWICQRKDPRLQRLIGWRVNDGAIDSFELDHFIGMAGGKDAPRGEPKCKKSPYAVGGGKVNGTINDCMLPLPNGEFYVSFFHFTYHDLGFTFLVKNASPKGSTDKVADDLREWLGELKFD